MKIKKNTLAIIAVAIAVFTVIFLVNRGDSDNANDADSNTTEQEYSENIGSLSPGNFSSQLENGDVILIDIRTQDEYDAGHIGNSEQIDYYQTASFISYLNSLDKDSSYLIYCNSGNRSGSSLDLMKEMGFKSVYDLNGGIQAWMQWGGEVVID